MGIKCRDRRILLPQQQIAKRCATATRQNARQNGAKIGI